MPDFLISRYNALKRCLKLFIIAILVFGVGFILGIIFNLKSDVKNPSYSNVEEFIKTVSNPKSNAIGIEIKFFLNCILVSGIIFASTLSVYALPVGFAALFVRGTVFGSCAVALIHFYKLIGLLLFLIVNFVQTAVTTVAYAAVIAENSDCNLTSKCKNNLLAYKCVTALICIVVCLIAALYGLIVITFIIRPICAVF